MFHKVNFTGNALTSYFHLKLDTAVHTPSVFVSLSFQGSFQHLNKWRPIPAVHPSSLLNSLVSLRWIHSLLGKKRKKEKTNAPFSSSVTSKKAASLTRSRPLGRRQQHTQTNQERRNNNKAKTKISVPNRFEEDVEVIALPDGSKLTHRGKPFKGELWMRVVRSLLCR